MEKLCFYKMYIKVIFCIVAPSADTPTLIVVRTLISINAIVTGKYKGGNVFFLGVLLRYSSLSRSKLSFLEDLNLDQKQT